MISNTGIFIHFIYRGSVHKKKKGKCVSSLIYFTSNQHQRKSHFPNTIFKTTF